jgi:hypothetical protein
MQHDAVGIRAYNGNMVDLSCKYTEEVPLAGLAGDLVSRLQCQATLGFKSDIGKSFSIPYSGLGIAHPGPRTTVSYSRLSEHISFQPYGWLYVSKLLACSVVERLGMSVSARTYDATLTS